MCHSANFHPVPLRDRTALQLVVGTNGLFEDGPRLKGFADSGLPDPAPYNHAGAA